MKSKSICIFTPILLSILGCQSLDYYDGQTRSNQELAEVYLTTSEALPVVITDIDEKTERFSYKKRLYLLPGLHTFKLRTNPYRPLGEQASPLVWGYFSFSVDLKPGMTYMFKSNVTRQHFMSRHSSLCIYEEPQDQIGRKSNFTNEYRSPTDDATKIDCSLVEIK